MLLVHLVGYLHFLQATAYLLKQFWSRPRKKQEHEPIFGQIFRRRYHIRDFLLYKRKESLVVWVLEKFLEVECHCCRIMGERCEELVLEKRPNPDEFELSVTFDFGWSRENVPIFL